MRKSAKGADLKRQSQSQVGPRILLKYSTASLSRSEIVRFYYALKGRDGNSGILKKQKVKFLAKGVLLARPEQQARLKEFFREWNVPVTVRKLQIVSSMDFDLIKLQRFAKSKPEISDILLIKSPLKKYGNNVVCVIGSTKQESTLIRAVERIISYKVLFFNSKDVFKPRNKRWLKLFSEGVSLLDKDAITPTHIIFKYYTSHLTHLERTQFFYAFKGRGNKEGVFQQTASEFLAKGLVLTSIKTARAMSEFFEKWKCSYEEMEVIMQDNE